MPKWCWNWPHCACGLEKAEQLLESGQRMMVFRNDVGDLKRVPCSEIVAWAIVEEKGDQLSAACPKTRGGADETA